MTDLDTALRAMLRERANDITTATAALEHLEDVETLDAGSHDLAPRHHVSRWLLVAAVAAVLALAGTLLAVRNLGHGGIPPVPPATQRVSPTPPAPTSGTTPVVVKASCTAKLPAAWQRALTNGTTHVSGNTLPLAMDRGGRLLATRDLGTSREVVLLAPGGQPRSIYDVPDPDNLQVMGSAALEGNWALLPVVWQPRNSNGVLPAVMQVVLVDVTTRTARVLDRMTTADFTNGKRTIDDATMQNGHVYWDVRTVYASTTGTIQDYDIATGTQRTLFTGSVQGPHASPAGVSWSGYPTLQIQAPVTLPAPVARAVGTRATGQNVASDGTAWAWLAEADRVGWWSSADRTTRYVSLPRELRPQPDMGMTFFVAGHFVYLDGHVIDMRTGATASMPVYAGGLGVPVTTPLFSGGGRFGGYTFAGPVKQSPTIALVIDTATLPGLSC